MDKIINAAFILYIYGYFFILFLHTFSFIATEKKTCCCSVIHNNS